MSVPSRRYLFPDLSGASSSSVKTQRIAFDTRHHCGQHTRTHDSTLQVLIVDVLFVMLRQVLASKRCRTSGRRADRQCVVLLQVPAAQPLFQSFSPSGSWIKR